MPWLQLIRWQNLLIILLTQFLAWWYVVVPESPVVLNVTNFCCLAFSTILIAAAGYIINDYFDVKIDTINRPEKVVLEKTIPRKQAIIAHAVLNIIALGLAGFVAVQAHHYEWLLLQVVCITLLWFYSTDFKRQYVTGNVVISLLTALTVIALIIYEPAIQREATMPLRGGVSWHSNSSLPVWLLLFYAYFAFMLTWMREIVKDMEDFKGDEAEGCATMPVKRGLKFAVRYILMLSALVIIPLAIASSVLYTHSYRLLAWYIIVLLVIPLVIWSVFINNGFAVQHYHKASRVLKIIMLLGVCSLLVYHLQLYGYLIEE